MLKYKEPGKVNFENDTPKNPNNFKDLVSIITPCYNSSMFISQTIESVLAQTYQAWEMIIVDDCSSDDTRDIIEEYIEKENRVKLIKLKKNSGPSAARNKAIEEAKGRYIAFLDSDDVWMPVKLENQTNFMKENNILLSYSSYHLIDENGTQLGTFITKDIATYEELLRTCYIGTLTAIYDASKIGKQYLDNINIGHLDYVLWLKILKNIGMAKGLLQPLAKYRIYDNSYSANKIKAAKWQWYIYRNVENLSLPKSTYYFASYAYHGFMKYRR